MRQSEALRDTLEAARALNAARDYPALHAALSSLAEDELFAEPELAFLMADVSRRVGAGDRALEVLDRLAPENQRRGNDRLLRNCLNLSGIIRYDRGQFPIAEQLWLRLLDVSSEASDAEFVARANNNLGIICTLDGRQEEALTYYGRAAGAYQQLGYLRGLAQAHQNLAITYREMGFFGKAAGHFDDAFGFARLDGSEDELGRVEQERALLILLEGDPDLARATAQRALGRYERLADPSGCAEVERVCGLVALSLHDFGEAERWLQRALDGARASRTRLLEGETLEALAALRELQARSEEALALRNEALRIFGSIGAANWGRRIRVRVAQIAGLSDPPWNAASGL